MSERDLFDMEGMRPFANSFLIPRDFEDGFAGIGIGGIRGGEISSGSSGGFPNDRDSCSTRSCGGRADGRLARR